MEREIIIIKNDKFTEPCEGCIYKSEEGCTNVNCKAVAVSGEVYGYASKVQTIAKRAIGKLKNYLVNTNAFSRPSDNQVGGDHYKKYAIQPVEFIYKNGIGYMEGNVIKYVVRHKDKNGIEDLRKAMHYLEMLIQYEEEK